jgi:hypothetical protein
MELYRSPYSERFWYNSVELNDKSGPGQKFGCLRVRFNKVHMKLGFRGLR